MALGSIPVGLLCDRVSRAKILMLSVLMSIASFLLTAFAVHFTTLFIARCLAGTSSAAILIASFSFVGDLFAPSARGRASTVLASGEIVGAPLSFALGGFLLVTVGAWPIGRILGLQQDPWRMALLCMGLFLVPVAALTLLLREPYRHKSMEAKLPLPVILTKLWDYRAIAFPVLFARGMVWIADGSVFVWAAPTFARRYNMAPDKIGALMGFVLLASGLLGPLLGGPLADACLRWGGPRRTMIALAGVALISAPAALFAVMPSPDRASLMMLIFLTLGFTVATAGVALSIVIIPVEIRGFYLGISFTFGSIFFVGLAPLAVSMLSGALGGGVMIGNALTIVCCGASLLGAAVFALSSRFIPADGVSSSYWSYAPSSFRE
jgi:MFS family permease